jgi:DNA uptake protein ComE-like DNA-binding protein
MTLRRPPSCRRSFVLVVVLIIVMGAMLVATSILFMTQAHRSGDVSINRSAQSRAVAWSGVQALMAELGAQRDRILEGERLDAEDEYVLYELDDRMGVARLLPLTTSGDLLVPEAGRLDLNTTTAEELERTNAVDAIIAQAIVAYRDSKLGRPFQSVAELLHVPGVDAELLYGPVEDMAPLEGGSFDARATTFEDGAYVDSEGGSSRGLADLVTVYGFEPDVQRDGKLRINLNVEWSEELGVRLDERFGEGAGALVKQIIDNGTTFNDDAAIVRVLRFFNTPLEDWADIIDALTTAAGEYRFGRVDLNTASADVLAALPGLTRELALDIVDRRDEVDLDARSTIMWPAEEGILETQAYEQLAGRITVRSWTYRFRLVAGEVDADDPDGPLMNPVVLEGVVDLCESRPRLAYLRDVTLFDLTARMMAHREVAEEVAADAFDRLADRVADAAALDSDLDDMAGDPLDGMTSPDPFGPDLWEDDAAPEDEETDRSDRFEGHRARRRSGPAEAGEATDKPPERRRIGRWLGGS